MASAADQMATNLSLSKFSQATELQKRLLFTIGALIIFRMLSYVPLPGIDPTALGLLAEQTQGGVLDFFNNFSGGALQRMSIVALGRDALYHRVDRRAARDLAPARRSTPSRKKARAAASG